jgi:hypothetical protein
MMIVSCSAVVLAIVAIIFTNLPPGPYPWVFLIAFFFLILIAGLLYKKMEIDRLNRENAAKMEQLDKENAIKNNCQIVIRAIWDQFESQRNACLEIKSKSSNTSHKEIQQIIQIIDQGLVHLYEQYQNCVNVILTSTDAAIFEQVKNNFYSHAVANQNRLVCCAQEINQLDILFSQQNLKRMLNEQCEPLMNKIEKLMEICCISIWTEKLNALKSEFDTFMTQTVSEVGKITGDMEQLEIKYNVEASLKDFGIKVQECKRTIEQKENMLKNIRKCIIEAESKYSQVMATLPNTSDEDFLDLENLKSKVDPVKAKSVDEFCCK